MKVLYKNLLDYGTVSATNENPNYPASNLTYELLRSRTLLALFKATGNTSTITCTLDAVQTIDAVGVGNHNLSQLVITLKNSGGSTLGTETFTTTLATSYDSTKLIELSTSYASVKTVEVALTTTSTYVSIGGLYVGEILDMKDANAFQPVTVSLTSSAQVTKKGVVYGRAGISLQSMPWPMSGVTKAELDSYITMFEYCQNNRPLFVEPNEGTTYKHWFARIVNDSLTATVYEGGDYDVQIDFEEVK